MDSARYWQDPFEHDAALADPQVAAHLDPIARAVSVAPAAQWWWSPVDLTRQSVVRWSGRGGARTGAPPLRGATSRLELWRADALDDEASATAERPEDPAAAYSGYWWSTPTHAGLVTTSRQLGRLPAVQVALVEDSMGWERARVARVDVAADARVLEIARRRTGSTWSRGIPSTSSGPDATTGTAPPAAPVRGRSPTGWPSAATTTPSTSPPPATWPPQVVLYRPGTGGPSSPASTPTSPSGSPMLCTQSRHPRDGPGRRPTGATTHGFARLQSE
ncbi:hypothetical protein FHX39_002128 [Friedmanniella antarctica]|uniref:Uncharacterized protein n=1 Tax=Microlunatus antarcticus TaxID=53388 RepID=A0A7W5P739_9ACTN|nr:hypothetical protein [Microlunatus antarcticus]